MAARAMHDALAGQAGTSVAGLAAAFGVIGLVLLVAQTRAIYCHGDFSGILHCHLFFTPDHDH